MGKAEINIFIVLATIILLLFINGIIIFIVQYRKRKIIHEKEKNMLNEQHSHELLHTQLQIQEQTMQDIGREIHDNVGQRLTLAAIYANQLSFENQYPEIQERLTAVGSIINESLAELRSLSKNLANATIEATELKELVENECRRINALNICHASSTFSHNSYDISATVKNFIIRIVQEFTQNSLKHAECTCIDIAFNYSDAGLAVTVADDGQGFDINSNNDKGIGLLNMKKRAELIGADFDLTASGGKGTSLQLFIPANKLNV